MMNHNQLRAAKHMPVVPSTLCRWTREPPEQKCSWVPVNSGRKADKHDGTFSFCRFHAFLRVQDAGTLYPVALALLYPCTRAPGTGCDSHLSFLSCFFTLPTMFWRFSPWRSSQPPFTGLPCSPITRSDLGQSTSDMFNQNEPRWNG